MGRKRGNKIRLEMIKGYVREWRSGLIWDSHRATGRERGSVISLGIDSGPWGVTGAVRLV